MNTAESVAQAGLPIASQSKHASGRPQLASGSEQTAGAEDYSRELRLHQQDSQTGKRIWNCILSSNETLHLQLQYLGYIRKSHKVN